MTEAQEKLFSLYKEIHDICVKHNIVYYMAGGTLIGAIRHRGFIPWDDDMDIMMTRDNWLKFIEVCKTDMLEGRVLECQENNRDYPNMFGRYTDFHSAAIHNNQVLGDGIAGYVVDILVLDPIPNKEAHKKYKEDLMLYSDLINPSLNYSYRYRYYKNKKRFDTYYKRMKKLGKEVVLSELESQMFSYKEEDCDYYVLRWGGVPFLFAKDMYGSSRWGNFEGVKCRIPDRTGDYLTQHYGDDWMYVPPHSEHESHDAIFSFTTDYKTIQKDYLDYIDVPRVRKSFVRRKRFFFNSMKKRFEEKDLEVQFMCMKGKIQLEKQLTECDFDLEEAFDNCEFEKLNTLFEEYFSLQLSRQIIGREDYIGIFRYETPAFVDIDDDVLYMAVRLLVHTNRIAKAARLLDIREQNKGALTKELEDVRKFILDIREAISAYDVGEKDSSYEKTKILYEQYPYNESLNMFLVIHLAERKKMTEVEKILDKAQSIFPKNGVFDKYRGDLVYSDNREEAHALYEKALENTANGYIKLEIEDILVAERGENNCE